MRRLILTAALVLLPACAAGAATPPASIVEEARQTIYDDVTDGATPEEIKEMPAWMLKTDPKMFSKVDLNGDKLADWRVNYENAPNASHFCGTGGCRNILYVGEADGTVRKVFQNSGGDYKFTGPRSARKLEVNLHGSACGSFGADECLRAWRWDGATGAYVETPNSKGLALLVSGSIPALQPELKDAPAEVKAEVAAREAACKAFGAQNIDGILISTLPDVNGDGRRDWTVGSSYPDCGYEIENPPAGKLAFFVSDGPAFVKAFEQQDAGWNLDIARSPATIQLVEPGEDCGLGEKPCPTRPLTWDPASKSLKP
ncbi:hypothetical protein [Caulobacter sp. NIBR1757]|uniref:hypothetical protein n=1 Tax=Caulobacter sp. NIBR1757 TaxID=3016000 RepID=UPI0022F08B82|nr:hypothetical protein [Caulobacter sp. NIBR1757]WGM39173.1 hypothetical protein AMEJIAPC_02088 [Caulobacter sp. NIBR1757]